MRLGQKSRRDRDRRKRYPPNRGYRGLGWVQVKLKFFHILTSAICAGTIALCSSMVSKKDV